MTGSIAALRQERLKKSARPNPPGLFTINEEDEQQKNGNSKRPKGRRRLCSAIRAGGSGGSMLHGGHNVLLAFLSAVESL